MASDLLDLEFEAVARCLIWVLGTEPLSSVGAVYVLSQGAVSPAPRWPF